MNISLSLTQISRPPILPIEQSQSERIHECIFLCLKIIENTSSVHPQKDLNNEQSQTHSGTNKNQNVRLTIDGSRNTVPMKLKVIKSVT